MDDLIRRSEAEELLECYTEKNNLGHTPYEIVSNLPSVTQEWICVFEKRPEIGVPVIVCLLVSLPQNQSAKFIGIAAMQPDDANGRYGWDFYGILETTRLWRQGIITHWLPLPEPPKEASDGTE